MSALTIIDGMSNIFDEEAYLLCDRNDTYVAGHVCVKLECGKTKMFKNYESAVAWLERRGYRF